MPLTGVYVHCDDLQRGFTPLCVLRAGPINGRQAKRLKMAPAVPQKLQTALDAVLHGCGQLARGSWFQSTGAVAWLESASPLAQQQGSSTSGLLNQHGCSDLERVALT